MVNTVVMKKESADLLTPDVNDSIKKARQTNC